MSLILGSPLYMAPELVAGQKYTSKIDVWAIGVLTYLLVQGVTPFYSFSIPRIH